MKYRREIDGLRAIAIIPVVLFHAGFDFFGGGYVGVDVFFVISGYLITSIILTEQEAGSFTILNFYERRARRILPALFFVVFVSIFFAWLWMLPKELEDFFQSVTAVSLFSSNVLFWLESDYFDIASEFKPLLHTWSLAVEEQYYVIFPLFIILTWRFGKKTIVTMIILASLASLFLSQWGAHNYSSANFYLLPTRVWELLVGSLSAFIVAYKYKIKYFKLENPTFINQILSTCGLILIIWATVYFNGRTPFPSFYTLVPTIGTALIIIFSTQSSFTSKLLGNKILVGIGLVSYSAYLWHQPLFAFARIKSLQQPSQEIIIALSVLTFVFAYLTWKLIENPFRHKNQFSRKVIFQSALSFTVILSTFGFAGAHYAEKISSYSPGELKVLSHIKKLKEERQLKIRADECHYNNKSGRGVDHFLKNWNCWNDNQSANLIKIPLIIVGDSHAADITVALKENGYLPLHMSGAGCSLNPDFMNKTCLKIFNKLFKKANQDQYFKHILIANQYDVDELSISAMKKTINYWRKYQINIILVTAGPEFKRFEKAAMLSQDIFPNVRDAQYSERSDIINYLTKRDVYIINKRALFCSITPNCSYKTPDGKMLIVDSAHLSRYGAEKLGQLLLAKIKLIINDDNKND